MTATTERRPERDWVFDSPEEQIASLEMRLRFARTATAGQRRKHHDARWLLTRIADALAAGEIATATHLAHNRHAILAERREQLKSAQ